MMEVIKNIFWSSNMKTGNEEVKNLRQEVGNSEGSQRNSIDYKENNKMESNRTPVTPRTPTSVIKRNLLEAFKEWEEDPAGEQISSANIIESK